MACLSAGAVLAEDHIRVLCYHENERAGEQVYFIRQTDSSVSFDEIKKSKWNKPTKMNAEMRVFEDQKDVYLAKFENDIDGFLASEEVASADTQTFEGKFSYSDSTSSNFKSYYPTNETIAIAFGYRERIHHVLVDQTKHVSHASMICTDIEWVKAKND